ncbi:MAG TPA: lytic transglycosylase domain-containing protein [Leucothrix mucor]|uniref:Lytic transglycosylase domain-containing protein n=1 Tax=Leucothrix mucor TaxID=45248 RepID=A0A7V2T063_LEUMU|nr:lytic transglycosylase domain-containing protein [Leucothrix mucor]
MSIQQRIWVGLMLFALIATSTSVNAKDKIRTCADLKTKTILKKADPFKATIEKYARKHELNADFVLAIAAVETCFNSRAVSPVGAKGLMQLMPATAKRFGVSHRDNTHQSVSGGTKYLKFLMKRYKHNMRFAAAAYNAGEGRVDRYKGVPPYRETRRYVKNVLRVYNKLKSHRKSLGKKDKVIRVSGKRAKKRISLIKASSHLKMYKNIKLKTPVRKLSERQTFLIASRLLLQ